MDPTVALVQTYLQVNGYLTVTEYPIVSVNRRGEARAATDIDLLAFRFLHAGQDAKLPGPRRARGEIAPVTDPALGCPADRDDMIVGEVKRGHARFNPAMRDPLVVAAALMRFGCCRGDEAETTARQLLAKGRAQTHCGHCVRLVAFGSQPEGESLRVGHSVSLASVLRFLQRYLKRNWTHVRSMKFSQPSLELLALMERHQLGCEPNTHG